MSIALLSRLAAVSTVALIATSCASSVAPAAVGSSAAPTDSAGARQQDPYAALVLHDGDTTTASGRVVSVLGRPVRFCAPTPEPSVGWAPGHEPAPQYCDYGVDVIGVNLATLTGRREKDGAIEGQAELTGVYRSGTLTVSRQQNPASSANIPIPPDQPPCPTPAGGWPQGATDENIDVDPVTAYSAANPGAIQEVAMLRPSHTQVLAYVLTTGDPGPVDAALAAGYHGRLCVQKSLYSPAQIAAAQQSLSSESYPGIVFITGQGLSARGQADLGINAVSVTPALAAGAAAEPAGLVTLTPWLAPAHD